jgi:hypothetical protein
MATTGKAAGPGALYVHRVASRPGGPAPRAGLGVASGAEGAAIEPAGRGASSAIRLPRDGEERQRARVPQRRARHPTMN